MLANEEYRGGHHIQKLADDTGERRIVYVVRDPNGRRAEDLAIAYPFHVSLPHKEGAGYKSDKNERDEKYLQRSVIENERECVASDHNCFNRNKLPFFARVFHKQYAAEQHAKIEKRACPCTYKQKIENIAKCGSGLHNKERAILLKLEGKHHYNKTYRTKAQAKRLGGCHVDE